MNFDQAPVSLSSIGQALTDAGIAAPVAIAIAIPAPAPVKAAAPVRVKALPYSEAQSFAFWTARTTEDKACALWAAIAPILSAYLVNGGTVAALKGVQGRSGPLAAHIHASKTRRDRAAQAVFGLALTDFTPRQCEYSETAHVDALECLELAFTAVLVPGTVVRKVQAKRYSLAEVLALAQTGNMPSDDGAAIFAALSKVYGPTVGASAKAQAPVFAGA